jgi:hypothetical protein
MAGTIAGITVAISEHRNSRRRSSVLVQHSEPAGRRNMNKEYGELMSLLLERRTMFATDEEFRRFAAESVRKLASDLADLNIEISIKPDTLLRARARDWNYLKIGCE